MPATTPYTRPTITKNAETGVRDGSSARRTFGPNSTSTTRQLRVNWAQEADAIVRYIGANQVIYSDPTDTDTAVRLNRLTPLTDPFNGLLYADRVMSKGWQVKKGEHGEPSDGSATVTYERSDLEIEYVTHPFKVKTDEEIGYEEGVNPGNELLRYVSIGDARPSTDYISLPQGTMKFIRASGTSEPNGYAIPYNAGLLNTLTEVDITWHRVPADIYDVFAAKPSLWQKRIFGDPDNSPATDLATTPLLGCVNKTKFLHYPAQTVLLLNCTPLRRFNGYGVLEWDIVFSIAICPNGWNRRYYPSANVSVAGWYMIGRGSTYYAPGSGTLPWNYSMYNEKELKDAFKVGP